jgi:hypothetical protein
MMASEQEQTREEKFFGVQNPIGEEVGNVENDAGNDEIQIEVIDDRPPEDQRPPADPEALKDDKDDDLENYSEGVKKRIKKLTFKHHEERRMREEAEREREEAIRFAKTVQRQNQHQAQLLASGEAELINRMKSGSQSALEKAEQDYKLASEAGDTDKLVEANKALFKAQADAGTAEAYERDYQQRRQQQAFQQQQPAPQPAPRPVQPTAKAAAWAEENPWFQSDDHKDMTALAYGVHEKLIRDEGVDPNSDEYFDRINEEMHTRFPDYFKTDEGQGSGSRPASTRPTPVVAPSARSNGAKPRTVKLRSSQVSIAKRLGLTPEQYAQQLAKEMS